ncbi:MAG: sensor histidine kinase, partial [Pseudomonas sp.]
MQQTHEITSPPSALHTPSLDERILGDTQSIASRLGHLKRIRKSSLLIGSAVIFLAILFGFIASRSIINAGTQQNTTLTAKFIQALGAVDVKDMGLAGYQTSDVLDPREDGALSHEAQ